MGGHRTEPCGSWLAGEWRGRGLPVTSLAPWPGEDSHPDSGWLKRVLEIGWPRSAGSDLDMESILRGEVEVAT